MSDRLELDPKRCALVVVDMQNDFVAPGGFHHRHGHSVAPAEAIVPTIEALLAGLPPEVRRVFVVTAREPDGSDVHWRFHRILPEGATPWVGAAAADLNVIRGSWGAEVVARLQPGPSDHVVYKRRFSAFFQTDLELRLRCWGVDTLFFTGVATEVCVESTLRDAFMRDFDVVLVGDAVASYDRAAHEASLQVVRRTFGAVLTAEQIRTLSWR